MRQSQSALLVRVHGEISETNSILGSDALVTSSAIAVHSWCELGARTTRSSICNAHLSLGSPTQKAISHSCCYTALADISACKKIKPYPAHPLTRLFATHHPPHVLSPTAAFPSHTFSAAVWPLIPAGAAGQRERVQEISTLSWLSMNDFKGTHRSYLHEISSSVLPA